MKNIIIGNDHAGVDYAKKIINYLENKGYTTIHVGTFSEDSVDYPDYGEKVGKLVKEKDEIGIVICGTGIGISIAANKISGIRCANCISPYMAEMSRRHNDANILALGSRTIDLENIYPIIDVFLETEFENGRHLKRVEKLNNL